jgi:hypothetical protein
MNEVSLIIHAGDAATAPQDNDILLAWMLENAALKNSYIPWAQKITAIANMLEQSPAVIYPKLTLLESLFDARSISAPDATEKKQLRQLRQKYSTFKRRLNKESKKGQKYLVDCGSGWLKIAFKFEGHWYGCDENPPETLGGVSKVWVMPIDGPLDPNGI